MNMIKKVFAVVLCVVMLASLASVGALVSAEEVAAPAGVRWFPCPENRQNDDAWEVECVKEGCLCQRFTETAEDTGNANFLDTVYTENGGLTITRNGNDATEGNYWPRIRTISLETSPEFDMKTADTFYFDFTVAEGTFWNVMLSINGINVKLSKAISDAAGVPGPTNSDEDGVAGTFKGSFNIWTALDEIKTENGTESSVNATAILNMPKTFVPQIAVFCVGPVGATLTLNEMFISTAADTTGANCSYVDMGLLSGLGDEYYEMMDDPAADGEEPATDGDADADVDGDADADANLDGDESEPTEDDTADTTTTTKKADKDEEGGSALPIILIVVAVVVVVVVVVVIVSKKKA